MRQANKKLRRIPRNIRSVAKSKIASAAKKARTSGKKKLPLKRKMVQPLVKFEQNPIISPRAENNWESWQTFNPGVILLDNKIHFLYRAIGSDSVSRLGYAVSNDGLTIDNRLSYPVYEHKAKGGKYIFYSYFSGGSFGGAEDPRLVRVNNEDILYMTYTACDNGLRVGLTSIKIDDFLNHWWNWRKPFLISAPDEVHKNWIIFPEKINGKYAIIHSIKPDIQIEYRDNLEFNDDDYIKSSHNGSPRKNCWDKWLRGAGAPPIKTERGWLLFYHAMDDDWSKYRVGAMLLDLKDPTKILRRAKEPVLEPEEFYENNGYKPGVVYVSGAVIKDDNLFVYYGGADSYICAATTPLKEFLAALEKEEKPVLKRRKIKLK